MGRAKADEEPLLSHIGRGGVVWFHLNYAHGEHSKRRPRSVDVTQG
jgi:hypothetical protein